MSARSCVCNSTSTWLMETGTTTDYLRSSQYQLMFYHLQATIWNSTLAIHSLQKTESLSFTGITSEVKRGMTFLNGCFTTTATSFWELNINKEWENQKPDSNTQTHPNTSQRFTTGWKPQSLWLSSRTPESLMELKQGSWAGWLEWRAAPTVWAQDSTCSRAA